MEKIKDAKRLAKERDAYRCRHCGSGKNLKVRQLTKREGALAWQLNNLVTLCADCAKLAEKNCKNKKNNLVGVMLAGGKGSRLAPLTKYNNKHALSIGPVPMCFYVLKTLRHFGVYRVIVVLDREGMEIANMLGSGKEWGLDITYKIQEGAGGISEALYLAKDLVGPKDRLVCILGDNIFDLNGLDTNVDLGCNKACVYLKQVSNPQDYGIAVMENGKIKEIIEKPIEFVSDLAVVGLYIYTKEVFDIIEQTKPSDRGELEISSINDYYAKKGQLASRIVERYWGDAGSDLGRYITASMYGAKQASISSDDINAYRSLVFDDK